MSKKGVGMYSAISVANYIIEYEHSKNRMISNLKLQKLLYFVQARFFIEYEQPCFDDRIEAWSFGPVVVNVYHAYKIYGSLDITKLKGCLPNNISSEHQIIINEELESYSCTPVYEMVNITHHQTPWVQAKRNLFNNEITHESLRQFFCYD